MKLGSCAVMAATLLLAGAAPHTALAQNTEAAEQAESQRLEGILKSQHRLSGDVMVPGAQATLHLGQKYYFLGAAEAKQVLTEWGNPPSAADGVLGMVFKTGTTFIDHAWAGVITYEPAGYVSDGDADKIDAQGLLDAEQKGEAADNEERKKAGFANSHLIGWAQPPSYDKARHYMIWARDIRFADQDDDTLNYDVRVLGRSGYLSVNVISGMAQLAEIRTEAAQLAGAATFKPGSAYADYKPGADHKADYGVAGLVAAGLGLAAAKKLGLLAIIAVFAKKFLVVIAAAFAALAAKFRRLFKKGPSTPA